MPGKLIKLNIPFIRSKRSYAYASQKQAKYFNLLAPPIYSLWVIFLLFELNPPPVTGNFSSLLFEFCRTLVFFLSSLLSLWFIMFVTKNKKRVQQDTSLEIVELETPSLLFLLGSILLMFIVIIVKLLS
jgi:hypothetical protein